ncbi:HAMP domain-containing histidine kinase [Paenarthrobacter sp. DKR-5]|uniref:sensor histidine kinase n=1 Tax=Paenarthrobacter sp. DKR-5 TaxID=2835535 RepID=UPI001BDCF1CD|nr:HAMP domain-containing sensor histidine kinase [Paenarthrobacter sp. DKR-5]MBT1001567.1 HAMP domain-containing histidine kinase [Paenarthrobacter sp. DKR-5]
MARNPDQQALRRASLKVGLLITAACAVMVVAVILAASLYMVYQAQRTGIPDPGRPGGVRVYFDSVDLLGAMVAGGVAGILLAGVVGWLSARSAIRPLGRALATQRRFVQDASHELRTPLTILDTRVQLALRKAPAGSDIERSLTEIRQDTAALGDTVTELLVAATGEHAAPPAHAVDVADVVERAVEDLRALARDRGITLDFEAVERPRSAVQQNSLRRAVLALADNALAHTPTGGRITVTVGGDRGHATVSVADTGSGIAGVDRERIFDRFVRNEGPAGAGRRSFGIGLALVREIAVGAGGTVEVASTGPDGTLMLMKLPRARS